MRRASLKGRAPRHKKRGFVDVLPLAKGIAVGAAIAAPVGPMAVLCMRRTLTKGWRFGFATGLGIATGDAIYAFVAALGLASVSHFMLAYDRPLHFAAGAFLLYLGLRPFYVRTNFARTNFRRTNFTRTSAPERPSRSASRGAGYASALLLTLTNIPTIVSFAAVFTVLAPAAGFGGSGALATVIGVFVGSALWWLLLTATVSLVREVLGSRKRAWIDGVSSALLSIFGVAEIKRAL